MEITIVRSRGTKTPYLYFKEVKFEAGIETEKKVGFKEIDPKEDPAVALTTAKAARWSFSEVPDWRGNYEVFRLPDAPAPSQT